MSLCLVQVLRECCMSAADLAAAVCGCTADDAADFKVQEAFCVVLEDEVDEALSSSAVTCQSLWRVVGAWDVTQKRAFVKFVTGTDRWGRGFLACCHSWRGKKHCLMPPGTDCTSTPGLQPTLQQVE